MRLNTCSVVWTQVLGDLHKKYLGSQLNVPVVQVNKTIWLVDTSSRSGCVWVYKKGFLFIHMFTCKNTEVAQKNKRGEGGGALSSQVYNALKFFRNKIDFYYNSFIETPQLLVQPRNPKQETEIHKEITHICTVHCSWRDLQTSVLLLPCLWEEPHVDTHKQ